MTNRIQLKNIKHAEFASQETHCYEASVWFDGKRIGTVSNDGHGGCDYEFPTDNKAWREMEDYIATLPKTSLGDFSCDTSLEIICGDLVNQFLVERDLKRMLKNRVVFQRKGYDGIRQTNCAKNKTVLNHWISQIADREDTVEVLNLLPFNKALEVFSANVGD